MFIRPSWSSDSASVYLCSCLCFGSPRSQDCGIWGIRESSLPSASHRLPEARTAHSSIKSPSRTTTKRATSHPRWLVQRQWLDPTDPASATERRSQQPNHMISASLDSDCPKPSSRSHADRIPCIIPHGTSPVPDHRLFSMIPCPRIGLHSSKRCGTTASCTPRTPAT